MLTLRYIAPVICLYIGPDDPLMRAMPLKGNISCVLTDDLVFLSSDEFTYSCHLETIHHEISWH